MAVSIAGGVTVIGGVVFETGALAQPWTLTTSPTQLAVTSNRSITNNNGLPNQYSDMQISPDGTKLSIYSDFSGSMDVYTLSPANTLGALPSPFNSANIGSNTCAFYWKPDGTKLLVLWWNLGRFYEYNTSAWTPSSISPNTVYTGGWASAFSTQTTGLYISDDGLKVFIAGDAKVARYNMGSAWTANTLSYDSQLSIAGASSVLKVFFKSDGTRMFVSCVASGVYEIRQYNLSSAWNLSTATLATTFTTTSYNNTGQSGLSFTSDGTNMYTAAFATNSAVRIWNTNA